MLVQMIGRDPNSTVMMYDQVGHFELCQNTPESGYNYDMITLWKYNTSESKRFENDKVFYCDILEEWLDELVVYQHGHEVFRTKIKEIEGK